MLKNLAQKGGEKQTTNVAIVMRLTLKDKRIITMFSVLYLALLVVYEQYLAALAVLIILIYLMTQ